MKEQSTYNWIAKSSTQHPDYSFLNQGVYIWVINWLKTPPHLALSVDGRYYSVTINESQINKPIGGLIRLFDQKRKPVFFVELNIGSTFSFSELDNAFTIALNTSTTCISPLNTLLFPNRNGLDTIAEMLVELENQTKIQHVHIPWYEESDFVGVKKYNKQDVLQFIDEKKNTYAPSI